MNDKFLIIKYLKKFIISIETIIMTFHKKDIISRNMIYNDLLEVLELIIMANYEVNKDVKHNYQIKAIAKINKIDFYLERAYKLKYISEKQVINKSNELLKINKMLYKWCSNVKNKRKLYNFDVNKMQNISNIKRMLESGNVGHDKYNIFLIYF